MTRCASLSAAVTGLTPAQLFLNRTLRRTYRHITIYHEICRYSTKRAETNAELCDGCRVRPPTRTRPHPTHRLQSRVASADPFTQLRLTLQLKQQASITRGSQSIAAAMKHIVCVGACYLDTILTYVPARLSYRTVHPLVGYLPLSGDAGVCAGCLNPGVPHSLPLLDLRFKGEGGAFYHFTSSGCVARCGVVPLEKSRDTRTPNNTPPPSHTLPPCSPAHSWQNLNRTRFYHFPFTFFQVIFVALPSPRHSRPHSLGEKPRHHAYKPLSDVPH